MTITAQGGGASASRLIAAEVRAEAARQGVSHRRLGLLMGVSYAWVNRRCSVGADMEITFEDAEAIAAALNVPVTQLLDPWLRGTGTAERPAAPGGGQAFLPLGEGFGAPSGTRTPNPLIPALPDYPNVVALRERRLARTQQPVGAHQPSITRTRRHLRVVGQEAS